MNFKKIAVTGAAAALLLSSAIPALASNNHERNRGGVEIEVDNHANVRNNVLTLSNTGFNAIGGVNYERHHNNSGGSINTGDALAQTSVLNDVNYTNVDLCGCLASRHGSRVEIDVDNHANVTNNVATVANTGFNYAGSGRIRTGDAGAVSLVQNLVNTTIIGGGSED